MNEHFAAADDRTAAAMMMEPFRPPTFRAEFPPHELDGLESLLTGRSTGEIAADSRFAVQVAEQLDEDGVAVCGVVAVTDTLTHVLATADGATLAAAAAASLGESSVRGLATVARQATQRGGRLYCFWYF
ncbi:MAG TPA: hypothetical protein VGN37_26105 [Actinocatenispora sp.]